MSTRRSYVIIVAPRGVFGLNFSQLRSELLRLRSLGYTIVFMSASDNSFVDLTQLVSAGSGSQFYYNLNTYVDLRVATRNFTRDFVCINEDTPPTPSGPGICASTNYRTAGMDVIGHPTECDKYVQCYFNPDGNVDIAVTRTCEAGLHYSQQSRMCVSPEVAQCANDPCLENCEDFKVVGGSCGAYWTCVNRRSTPMCCPSGQAFVTGRGCVDDDSCTEPCGAPSSDCMCRKRPNFQQVYGYDVQTSAGQPTSSTQWSPRPCPGSGKEFDIVSCGCTVSSNRMCRPCNRYNFLDGQTASRIQSSNLRRVVSSNVVVSNQGLQLRNNSMIMFRATRQGMGPWALSFRIRESQSFSPYGTTLVSTGSNCGGTSFTVTATDQVIAAQLTVAGQSASVSVPYAGMGLGSPKNITVTYGWNQMGLSVRSQNLQYVGSVPAPANATCFGCGLNFGGSVNENSFNGLLQEVSLYMCQPGRLYDF